MCVSLAPLHGVVMIASNACCTWIDTGGGLMCTRCSAITEKWAESQALVVPLIHLNEATIAGGCHTDDYGVLWADDIQVTCTISRDRPQLEGGGNG